MYLPMIGEEQMYKEKHKQPHSGFELGSPIPFSMMITIILSVNLLINEEYQNFTKTEELYLQRQKWSMDETFICLKNSLVRIKVSEFCFWQLESFYL